MRLRRGEQGFSVVELTITMAISSVVMAALASILISQTKVERRMQAFSNTQQDLRQAVLAIERDLRSSEPLVALPSSSEYNLRVDLSIYPEIDSPTPTPLRWRVDLPTHELRREQTDGLGNVVATTYRVRGVENSDSDPLFEFYKANGDKFAVAEPSTDIADCTVRVHVNLAAAPNAGAAASRLVSEVQLRNRRSGGIGCPVTPVTP